jgi:hypothetical protein
MTYKDGGEGGIRTHAVSLSVFASRLTDSRMESIWSQVAVIAQDGRTSWRLVNLCTRGTEGRAAWVTSDLPISAD